jgi:predicted ATPase/DNA-binding XRE family transcriptional regulator
MKSSGPPLYFGEWIKQRRKLLDLTQDELARKTGCSVFALRKIESGDRRPSKQLAELLAESLEISAEEKTVFIRAARGEINLERMPVPSHDCPPASFPTIGFPTASSPDSPPPYPTSKVPLQSTSLVGRDNELATIEKILKDQQCRLLTLTGVGGIGKTRLAMEIAIRKGSSSQSPVFCIPLTPVNNPEKIIPAIADVLDFRFSGPVDPKEQLFNYLNFTIKEEALFIFDNLEHLLIQDPKQSSKSGLVELINEIIQRLPNVKILGTSRERLNLYGEWTFELHGLPVPPKNFLGRLEEYDSIALFIKRALRRRTDFQPALEDQNALIQICQMVEGVPLAIELAAAWVGILTCNEIAQEIKTNLDFLSTSMWDIPERHRSIRATFDHSWNLLTNTERLALCQLSVFRGGFDRTAAHQIAGATLDLLASLCTKSLLHRPNNGRYDLHEVIRQYSLSHLNNRSDNLDTYERHCRYYLEYVQEREKSLKNASQQEAIRQLTDEIDNIRSAWEWAIGNKNFSLTAKSVRGFGWYFEIAGLYREGIEQLDPLVQLLKEEDEGEKWNGVLGLTQLHQALLYFRLGEFESAKKLYEESIGNLRPTGDIQLLMDALIYLGTITHLRGEYDQAFSLLTEGLDYAHAVNDQWFEAFGIYNLGFLSSLNGLLENGHAQLLAGLNIWRKLGDPHAIALGLNYLVPTLIKMGRFEEASTFMQESIALCEQSKNRWGMGTAYRFFGLSKLAAGQIKEAKTHLQKSLEIFGEYIVGWDIARTLSYLGDAALLERELPEAWKIYLNAMQLSIDVKAIPIALDCILGLAQIAIETDKTDIGLSLTDFVFNHPASPQEAKERAQILFEEAQKLLTDKDVNSFVEWPDTQSIERILEFLLMVPLKR